MPQRHHLHDSAPTWSPSLRVDLGALLTWTPFTPLELMLWRVFHVDHDTGADQ